ncbi:MAG: hypothetical protein ABIO44_02790 [Saprospiraceae bacterium]
MEKLINISSNYLLNLKNPVILFNRVTLFVVFFWFGVLKVMSLSPAEGLVTHLHSLILAPFVSINIFLIFLGLFECLIGALWLMPKFTKLALILFSIHIFTTFLPLVYLPHDTWQNSFVLTLTGQYIIKNLVLISCAFTVYVYRKNNPDTLH